MTKVNYDITVGDLLSLTYGSTVTSVSLYRNLLFLATGMILVVLLRKLGKNAVDRATDIDALIVNLSFERKRDLTYFARALGLPARGD